MLLAQLRSVVGEVDLARTERPGHAIELAAGAAARRRQLVICYGGDGTLSEIAHGLLGGAATPRDPASLPRIALVAAGTGSDFGRGMGIPDDRHGALAVIAGGGERVIDAGWARFLGHGGPAQRVWLNVLSAGLGGHVDRYTAAAPSALPGRLAYAQATLRAIVTCRRVAVRCQAQLADGGALDTTLNAYAIMVCNGSTFGAGMRIAPMARADDGLLEIVTVETRSKLRMLLRLGTVYTGRHLQQPGIAHFRCRQVTLTPVALAGTEDRRSAGLRRGAGVFPLDVDGDPLGDIPLAIGILPQALRIAVPSGQPS